MFPKSSDPDRKVDRAGRPDFAPPVDPAGCFDPEGQFDLLHHKTISLYIHIPFCSSRCDYCDFFSTTGASSGLISATLDSVLEDARVALEALGYPYVSTVFIGGGTPSMVEPRAFGAFISELNTIISGCGAAARRDEDGTREPVEFTVEANPETITEKLLDVLDSGGVNRLSVGIQTFDEEAFRYLGRRATPADNRRALDLIAHGWKGELSFDLVTGMPIEGAGHGCATADGGADADTTGTSGTAGSNAAGTAESGDTKGAIARSVVDRTITDLQEALQWNPDHISLYTLTVEEGTELSRRIAESRSPPVDEEEQAEAFIAGSEYLEANGYARYEVSNFARPGKACEHNMSYWRMHPYLGLGPSAVSTLGSGAGPVRIESSTGLPSPEYRQEILSPRDFFFEHLIMGLRLSEGVYRSRIERIFGIDPVDALPSTLEKAKGRGFVEITDDILACSPNGLIYLDSILRDAAEEISDIEIERCDWPEVSNQRNPG